VSQSEFVEVYGLRIWSDEDAAGYHMRDSPTFEILNCFRNNRHFPTEIEVLPSKWPIPAESPTQHVLVEENSLGIPKHVLIHVFAAAQMALSKHFVPRFPEMVTEREFAEMMGCTLLCLLVSPEHLTAANFRKRCIVKMWEKARSHLMPWTPYLKTEAPGKDEHVHQDRKMSFGETPLPGQGKSDIIGALGGFVTVIIRELSITESFVTSRLSRHAKSPNIWSHRKWVLRTASPGFFEAPRPLEDITGFHFTILPRGKAELLSAGSAYNLHDPECWRGTFVALDDHIPNASPTEWVGAWESLYSQELELVFRAALVHPRNYYAFEYARWIWRSVTSSFSPKCFLPQLWAALDETFAWCSKHGTDTSGWSYLSWLVEQHHYWVTSASTGVVSEMPRNLTHDVVTSMIERALKYGGTEESLWGAVRSICSNGILLDDHKVMEYLDTIGTDPQDTSATTEESKTVYRNRAIKWIRDFRTHPSSVGVYAAYPGQSYSFRGTNPIPPLLKLHDWDELADMNRVSKFIEKMDISASVPKAEH
jgi:Protein prenyltransferase alpha subunit repeat